MNEIIQAVSTVGFPIVMSIILLYELRENTKIHNAESTKLSESLNENTVVLMQLKQLLEDKIFNEKEEK